MKNKFKEFCKFCLFCAVVCAGVGFVSHVTLFWWLLLGFLLLIPIGAFLVDDGVSDEEEQASDNQGEENKISSQDGTVEIGEYRGYWFFIDKDDPTDESNHKLKILRKELKWCIESRLSVSFDKERKDDMEQFAMDCMLSRMNEFVRDVKKQPIEKVLSEYDYFLKNAKWMVGANINEKYAALKREEIQVVNDIKLIKEAERERIREENKAQAEWRREQRRAEEEQKRTERELRESERLRLQAATEEERERYRLQVEELTARLQEAEGRVARAISMAQQTKCGYVYIISNEGSFGPDVCKIGLTRRLDPQERVDELGDASVPFPFTVHRFIYSDDAPALEAALHRYFADRRVNADNWRKEFFRVSPEEAMTAAEELAG